MTKAPEFSPGTVSKILWHFTGGPKWNDKTQKQGSRPKASADAYRKLTSILKSRELKLGSYKETVRAIVPEQRIYDPRSGKLEIRKNVPAEISSAPVCCLSDIPAAHLSYHSYRYGKFAIGFHRSVAVRHGFNPVFYSPEHSSVVKSIYTGFKAAEDLASSIANARWGGYRIDSPFGYLEGDIETTFSTSPAEIEAELVREAMSSAGKALEDFAAFVKTFQSDEFNSIYCEREWRALKTFTFRYEDVAMIVVPRCLGSKRYFEDFITKVVPRLKLPRSIPIVPWEDLVEH